MDLTPYIQSLRSSLTSAAGPAGEDATRTAELLADALDAGARLALLEALSDAAAEITDQLDRAGSSASVDVRVRGRAADLTVSNVEAATVEPAPAPATDDNVARITLRLPESLKDNVEAAAATEGISVNAWLVRAINNSVHGPTPQGKGSRFNQRITGYARA
ncbi:toxin-antitoxin system HicB family antitoxin [Natronoglycomyces albus]|uniref:Toxin-antitoxin system HicB family antitoxin n=1 Tax=Natronoglycomyces albus TaxID=2811108 RepID=A0A895XL83_9ACTN|nr:toxin-antitoxin system HicB family antitoxin [Natronoglycomyces albus]QSB04313.1 toxin-antitoxin system HicB family antitoxin [Natronoglycomyces albus]